MVTFNEIQKQNNDEYDSKTYKSYKRYKQYKKQIEDNEIINKPLIENKYFNCLYCGKVNRIEDIISEKSHNMTMRARYLTWKKLKDISNELGGSLENGLNYLISLHEGMLVPNPNEISDERTIGIAGFGGDDKQKVKKKR